MSFPSRDVAINMTMELGIVNVSLAISDIIQTLIYNLPDILAANIVFSPERIDELSIKYEGETRQARYCHIVIMSSTCQHHKEWDKIYLHFSVQSQRRGDF